MRMSLSSSRTPCEGERPIVVERVVQVGIHAEGVAVETEPLGGAKVELIQVHPPNEVLYTVPGSIRRTVFVAPDARLRPRAAAMVAFGTAQSATMLGCKGFCTPLLNS